MAIPTIAPPSPATADAASNPAFAGPQPDPLAVSSGGPSPPPRSPEQTAHLLNKIDQRMSAPPLEVDEELEPYLAEMRGYRATYLTVVSKARAANSDFNPVIVLSALDEFDAIEAELIGAQTDVARKTLVDRAEEVEQSRAYLQPLSELLVEAKTCFADMSDWGVPIPVLEKIDGDLFTVMKETKSSLEDKRAALNKLYAYYDAWSDHVTDYESWAKRTAWFLGILLGLSVILCVILIVRKEAVYGFGVGGLTGALMSVLGKFPPMLGWGQWASYTPRMLGRITTGLVGTLAGGALLALDVVRIGQESFATLFTSAATPKQTLLLIGLGIVFGFSERALLQFQQIVFKGSPETGTTTTL